MRAARARLLSTRSGTPLIERLSGEEIIGLLKTHQEVVEMNPTNCERECKPDALFAELIETVWACEDAWSREDRIVAAIRQDTFRSRIRAGVSEPPVEGCL